MSYILYTLLFGNFLMNTAENAFEKKDCLASKWGPWSSCSLACSVGTRHRARTIIQKGNHIFADCPKLKDSESCDSNNNGCDYQCSEPTGKCLCPTGFQLLSDTAKVCNDTNECYKNYGLGDCDQVCHNIKKSYKCSCYIGFELSSNHSCNNIAIEHCSLHAHTNINGVCICKDGNKGYYCNRNSVICHRLRCKNKDSLCTPFINSPEKCIDSKYQIPILLKVPFKMYNSGMYKSKIEIYLASLIEHGQVNDMSPWTLNSPNKFESLMAKTTNVAVELSTGADVLRVFTYVTFAVHKNRNENYSLMTAAKVCQKLYSTNMECINMADCKILRNAGYLCPNYIYVSPAEQKLDKDMSDKNSTSYIWLYCALAILVMVVLIVAAFICRRKTQKSNHAYSYTAASDNVHLATAPTAENVPCAGATSFSQEVFRERPKNILYGQNSIDGEALYESIDNLPAKIANQCSGNKLVVDLNNSQQEKEARYSEAPCRKLSDEI